MGNCFESFKLKHNQQTEMIQQEAEAKTENEVDEKSGKLRVKIVLTKEELDWLMLQLESKDGKGLEDVLDEIEKNRGKALLSVSASSASWKPCLDSIVESPEIPETMDR